MRCLFFTLLLSSISAFALAQNQVAIPSYAPKDIVINYQHYQMDSLYVRTYETEEVMALIEKMEGLNENSNSKVHFPWKDVIASIFKKQEPLILLSIKCKECQHNLVLLYFVSPPETWQALCGTAGYLVICPHCIKQIDYDCSIIS